MGGANWESPDLGPSTSGGQSESRFHQTQPHCCLDSAFQIRGAYLFMTLVACQGGWAKAAAQCEAVTFAATDFMEATAVFRSDELHGRLGEVTAPLGHRGNRGSG